MKNEILIRKNEIISNLDDGTRVLLENAISKVSSFFDGRKINFSVVFLDTREEMNEVHGSKTEDWVVGGVYSKNTLYIFNKEVFEKVSSHKKEEFFQVLVHEITHIFSKDCFNLHYPMWLSEGLSFVVAEQDLNFKNKSINQKELLSAHNEAEWNLYNPYKSSGIFVKFLFETYGKDKMFKLLKILDKFEEKDSFKKKFKSVICEDFDKVLNTFYLTKAKI